MPLTRSEVDCITGVVTEVELTQAEIDALPVPTLAETQTAQLALVQASYEAAIQVPVSYMSTTFQADEYSQLLVTKCLSAGSVPTGFYWLDANNVQVPMTFTDLQGLAGTMLIQGQTAFSKLQTFKTQIRAATTIPDVQLVVW